MNLTASSRGNITIDHGVEVSADPPRDRCDTCFFWDVSSNEFEQPCRRFPPQAGPPDYRLPLTMANEWCGEWQKK